MGFCKVLVPQMALAVGTKWFHFHNILKLTTCIIFHEIILSAMTARYNIHLLFYLNFTSLHFYHNCYCIHLLLNPFVTYWFKECI